MAGCGGHWKFLVQDTCEGDELSSNAGRDELSSNGGRDELSRNGGTMCCLKRSDTVLYC